MKKANKIATAFACFGVCAAAPSRHGWERATQLTSISQLTDAYDYVIVGGGTAGLTVADRLTEDAKKTVLVVDFGTIIANDTRLQMPSRAQFPPEYMYPGLTSIPQPGLNGRTGDVPASNIVGGGSAINAMFFDRGAKADYDAWAELGNKGWGWDDLLPYFKKAVNFTPPSEYLQHEFNATYDLSAYGGRGPIQLSYPPFQWPGLKIQWDAWDDMNLAVEKEGANGNAVGRFWIPSSQHPVKQMRVDARLGHYERVKSRPNYHLLTLHKATKINFARLVATGVNIQSRETGKTKTVIAKKEVILAAGAAHTPQLLQLSGVGPKKVLSTAGVKTLVDLDGVGNNFQDHPWFFAAWNFTTNVWPNPETLTENATFAAAALAEYWANRTGPYTRGVDNTAAFIPLLNLTSEYQRIASTLSAQDASSYVDPSTPKSVLKGYAAQLKLLANRYKSTDNAVMEYTFGGQESALVAFLKPTSRGTIHISSANSSVEPTIDFKSLANPVDAEIMMRLLRYLRQYYNTPTMAQLGPVELVPGPAVSTDEEIIAVLRNMLVQPSFFHPCCTAAMSPRNKGGVVGTDLLVYGVKRLSVVDASVMPLIPGTHTCETVYAIAEKASDIIRKRS